MLSMAFLLLKCQIRWYSNEVLNRVIKLKHSVIILFALTIPSTTVLISLVASPFASVLKPKENHALCLFLNIFLLEAVYILLIAWQRNAFTANQEQYYHSLPINKSTWKLTLAIRLLIANNIFLLPIFLLPFLIELPSTLYGKFIFVVRFLLLIVYIFMGQLAYLRKKYTFVAIAFLADLLIALDSYINFSFHPSSADYLLILAFFLLLLLFLPYKKLTILNDWRTREYIPFKKLFSFNINYLILARRYKVEMTVRLFLSSLITYCCSMLYLYSALTPNFLAILQGSTLSLLMSGLFPLLKNSRQEAGYYLNALPISKVSWYIKDYWAVTSINVIFTAGFLLANNLLKVMTTIALFYCAISILILPILLATFQNRLSRFATLASTTMVFTWLIIIGLNVECL